MKKYHSADSLNKSGYRTNGAENQQVKKNRNIYTVKILCKYYDFFSPKIKFPSKHNIKQTKLIKVIKNNGD